MTYDPDLEADFNSCKQAVLDGLAKSDPLRRNLTNTAAPMCYRRYRVHVLSRVIAYISGTRIAFQKRYTFKSS